MTFVVHPEHHLEQSSWAAPGSPFVRRFITPNAYAPSSSQAPRTTAADDPARRSRIPTSTALSARMDCERAVDRSSARCPAPATARALDAAVAHAVARDKQQYQPQTIPHAAHTATQVRWTPASRGRDRITTSSIRSVYRSHPGVENQDFALALAWRFPRFTSDIRLEQRGTPTLALVRPVRHHSLIQTLMNTIIARPVLQVTDLGTVSIPFDDWQPVIRAVEDDFEGEISIHDHDAPGACHGWPLVPTPHYLIEISVDEEKVEELIEVLNPLIDEIVTRNTSDTLVPALR